MNPKERFLIALAGGIPDRIPIMEHLFSQNIMEKVLGYKTELYDGSAQVKLATILGIDAIWTPINGFCGIENVPHKKDEIYVDEWGVTYRKNGWPIIAQIDTPIKSRDDWNRYKMPLVHTPERFEILRSVKQANDGDLAVILGILGPFTMASWYLMDFSTLAIMMYTDPELIHQINEAVLEWTLSVVRSAIKDEGGVDCVEISDDWGSTTSLLLSPDDFRNFFLPYLERLVKGIRQLGVPVIMHNDGKLWEILDDIVATGINALHPVERAAGMDLKRIKERYKGIVTPIGNVNNKITMASADVEDVKQEVLECIKDAGINGGYIISSDHSIHDLIPIENLYCLIDTVKKYGCYPINI